MNLIEGYSRTVLGGDKRGAFAGTAASSDLRQFEGFGDLDTAGYKVGPSIGEENKTCLICHIY